MGRRNNTEIHNLTIMLSRIQNVYNFVFNDDTIIPEPSATLTNGQYEAVYLEQLIKNYMNKNNFTEYPIGITDVDMVDRIFTSNDKERAIISTKDLDKYSSYPLIKVLEYAIPSILLDLYVSTEPHYDTKKCPNDVCENPKDMDLGIAKCEFCDECNRMINSAFEIGNITLSEIVAIKRILDDVANRKICFILMPFKRDFDAIYKVIKFVIEDAGFKCIRADEIFEPRSIIHIICEMIGRAEIIIADLTGRNANVFYELGYAHAFGKNSIIIAQKKKDVPFDLQHRQCVFYNPDELDITLGKMIPKYFSNLAIRKNSRRFKK